MIKKLFAVLFAAAALMLGPSIASAELVKYQIVDDTIPKSLTGKSGDAMAGEKAAIGRKAGNCLACHQISKLDKEQFHGNIGPSLDGVADRWNEGQMRLILVNSKAVFEDSIMPGFYTMEGRNRVAKKFKGKTILSAQQIEDIVAFLRTLK